MIGHATHNQLVMVQTAVVLLTTSCLYIAHRVQANSNTSSSCSSAGNSACIAGGIFFPLAKALCLACGSDPAKGTEKKMGAYVMKTCFQTSCISSAMFITAMAANPLAVNLASEALGQPISWGAWALAGIVPGLICLAAAPLILYILYPPGKPQANAIAYSIQGCPRVHAVGN